MILRATHIDASQFTCSHRAIEKHNPRAIEWPMLYLNCFLSLAMARTRHLPHRTHTRCYNIDLGITLAPARSQRSEPARSAAELLPRRAAALPLRLVLDCSQSNWIRHRSELRLGQRALTVLSQSRTSLWPVSAAGAC